MLKERENVIKVFMLSFDAIILILVFIVSHVLRQNIHNMRLHLSFLNAFIISEKTAPISQYILIPLFIVPFWCLMFLISGVYHSIVSRRVTQLIWLVSKSTCFAALAFGAVVFIFQLKYVSRMLFVMYLALGLSVIVLEKTIFLYVLKKTRKRLINEKRLLIVGTGKRAFEFITVLKKQPECGLKILGAIEDDPSRGIANVNGIRVIGMLDEVTNLLHALAVDEVIFVLPRSRLSCIEPAIIACELEGVRATVAVDLFNVKIARSHSSEISGIPLLTFETTVAREWQLVIKRMIDITLACIALVLTGPAFLAAAVLIKATSKGPVLFKQERVGLNGRRFILYKLRTMHNKAKETRQELSAKNEMRGPVFKIRKDPRVTSVGRLLRKSSFDEIPQLINVICGHMSLVGPRPPLPEEVEQYEPWQRRRLSMRPGITCLWQVSGRSKVDFIEWMKLDLHYLDSWSLLLDIKILLKTIPSVLMGNGAY